MPTYIEEKQKWIDKLFKYKDDNVEIVIDRVLYFGSKNWYIGYIMDKTSKKYFMAWFSHNQPNAKDILDSNKVIEIIYSDDDSYIPSTATPICDAVEIMYNSAINDMMVNLNTCDMAKDLSDTVEKVENLVPPSDNDDEYKRYKLENFVYRTDTNIQLIGLLKTINNSWNVNKQSSNVKLSYAPWDNLMASTYSTDIEKRDEAISIANDSDSIKKTNNHLVDDYVRTIDNSKNVLIIGHMIRIGKILNESKLFKGRYSSTVGRTKQITNLHHTSIEMDNHWNHTSSMMMMKDGEESLDFLFKDLQKLNQNKRCLKSELKELYKELLTFSPDVNLSEFSESDDNIVNNKFIDYTSDRNFYELDTLYNLSGFINFHIDIIDKESEDDWFANGIKEMLDNHDDD